MNQLTRRQVLLSGVGATAACLHSTSIADENKTPRRPVLLSKQGCGRATAYVEANRIVTQRGHTHVTWLDSTKDGFRLRVRTLDRETERWSPTYTVGNAHDNHGGPALTVDSQGFLHLVYYPHHHAFRYRKSKRPNDASQWEDEIQFGDKLTYPTFVCGPDDSLHLTTRRSRTNQPWSVEHWRKPPEKDWQVQQEMIRSRAGGYSHFQEALAWSPDHRRLHLSCRIYENGGRRETVAYMRSDDFGKTWQRRDGMRIELPATANTMDVIAVGGRVDGLLSHKCGSVAVDPEGTPHILYSASNKSTAELLIASPNRGGWRKTPLANHLQDRWPAWRISPPAMMVFDRHGTMFVITTISHENKRELVMLSSRDQARTFTIEHVSQGIAGDRKMMPSLERPTGHNTVGSPPGLIFTAGTRGEGNDDLLSNAVYWLG